MPATITSLNRVLGVLARAAMPAAVVQRLSDLIREAAETPRVREINKAFGMPAAPAGY